MVIKKFNQLELAQKIQSSSNGCNMHVHRFWWAWPLHFQRYCYFQKTAKFPFGAWTIVHGHQKILSIGIGSKKFMQVGVDVTCMYTDFGGCGLSTFGDIATFKKQPNFPFGAWTIVHAHQKI